MNTLFPKLLKMNYFIYPIALLFFGVAFSSCKTDVTETVYPKSYYPCYPGSWWVYLENDSIEDKVNVSANYESHFLRDFKNGETTSISDPKMVPVVNSVPFYGYDFVYHRNNEVYNTEVLWPILKEQAGVTFDKKPESTKFGDFNEHVTVKGKFFNGTDSILILEGQWVYGPNVSKISYETYTKNIGLTSRYVIDTIQNDTTYKLELQSHFINK